MILQFHLKFIITQLWKRTFFRLGYVSQNINSQMLQKLPRALTQVKAGNKSNNLVNQICQIMYSLVWEKEITEKVYNNIMNSVKL